jgi:outer membrane lipoprotein-sorting protein
VPAGIVALAVAVPSAGAVLQAAPSPSLPPMTAQQLLAAIQTAKVNGLSGTVVQSADLGLPSLPGLTGMGAPSTGSSSLTSMASGSHTLRVWYAGPDKGRIALLGQLGESDVVLNNHNLWTWSSSDKTATHRVVQAPAHTSGTPSPDKNNALANSTPQEIAAQLLKAVGPTTNVSTTGNTTVAGRKVYELLLQPKDTRSLVGQVKLSIDGETKLPLQVEVFAAGAGKPAIKVGFTQVTFATPSAANFTFTPPPGAKVTEEKAPAPAKVPDPKQLAQHKTELAGAQPTVVGKGWTSVMVAKLPANALTGGAAKQPTRGDRGGNGASVDPQQLLSSLPKVSGSWGSGRLLSSALFSALITDDGRVLVGAVQPSLLYAAAGQK